MTHRILSWVWSRSDHNVLDDRPPPTVIHVALLRKNSPKIGVGLFRALFISLSVFFEFDWYNHEEGVDIVAFVGLLLFTFFGTAIRSHVAGEIKSGQAKHLVPFING
ncbi:unnamed protein product [Angiostrongylus costaricensis]|uniref:Na_H_Exchanger domain-containing protein n=1 Tax=Angiostrongylus costaricensis TaxID=334426 RepID=A0A0R3PT18_ANGCS|nr:unnamed protein product [Angiostrongylus costaricensis]